MIWLSSFWPGRQVINAHVRCWLKALHDAFDCLQFTYKADSIQLNFLQLLSENAYQNVTYHCRNSVAYYDNAEKTFDKAVKFQSHNDVELVAQRPTKLRYSVKLDECQVSEPSIP